jgi:hypothetical protein
MESNSANAPSANGSTGVEAAGKAGERETNAPNLFEAPQAAEEQETNAPCPRETREHGDMGNQRVGEGYCRRQAGNRFLSSLKGSTNRGRTIVILKNRIALVHVA